MYSYDAFLSLLSKECLCFFVVIFIIKCVDRQEVNCWIEQNFYRNEVETAVVGLLDNILKANSSLKIDKL